MGLFMLVLSVVVAVTIEGLALVLAAVPSVPLWQVVTVAVLAPVLPGIQYALWRMSR